MKRREIIHSAVVLPVAASIPTFGEEDWKSRMHRAIEAHMSRSETMNRVLGYAGPISDPSLYVTSDVRLSDAVEGLGAEVPRFHMSVFVTFSLDRELEVVDDIVRSYETRLDAIEASLLRRAAETQKQGRIFAACTPGEFYGADHGEEPILPWYKASQGAELVPPGHRAVVYTNQWQMIFR
jgi:hypothetical protein